MGFVKRGRKQGCMFLTRTVKRCNILKVKNALSMPVQHVTEYTTCSFVVLLDSLGALICQSH
jgi:hypothetical protein